MAMYKHTKWIIIVVLLAICSQSWAATLLPAYDEGATESALVMDHASHAMGEHQEAEHSGHAHSGMSDHEEHCKFKCDCILGSCFNGAQLISLSGLTQRLSVESKFGQPGQIAESQSLSPLYRPPIF